VKSIAIDRVRKREAEKLRIGAERAEAADEFPAFVLRPVKLTKKKTRKKKSR